MKKLTINGEKVSCSDDYRTIHHHLLGDIDTRKYPFRIENKDGWLYLICNKPNSFTWSPGLPIPAALVEGFSKQPDDKIKQAFLDAAEYEFDIIDLEFNREYFERIYQETLDSEEAAAIAGTELARCVIDCFGGNPQVNRQAENRMACYQVEGILNDH